MSWMRPTARKAATYGAKYGPHAVVVWNVAGEHIQAAARAKAAEIAERRKAFAEADAVVDGSVLRVVDHGTVVFVVFTGEEPVASYPETTKPLDQLNAHLVEPIQDCLATDANGEPCIEARTPLDLEEELGLPGGNIFHGELDWPFAEARDEIGTWGVETDVDNVFVCGDMGRGQSLIVWASAEGRSCASAVDQALMGSTLLHSPITPTTMQLL